jgi:hypothetical protein
METQTQFNRELYKTILNESAPEIGLDLEDELERTEDRIYKDPQYDGAPSGVKKRVIDLALNDILNQYKTDFLEPELEAEPEEDQEEMPEPEEDPAPEPEPCTLNPLAGQCEDCGNLVDCFDNYLKLTANVPFFVIDEFWPILSRHAAKILIFLARRANFGSNSTHFGRCWATHEQIEAATGVPVSNMRTYINQLVDLNLITKTTNTRQIDGKIKSTNQYSVTWFKRLKDLKIKVIEQKSKDRANKKKGFQ